MHSIFVLLLLITFALGAAAQTAIPNKLRGFELGRLCSDLKTAIESNRKDGLELYPSSSGERPCEMSKETGSISNPIIGRMQRGRYKEMILTEFNEKGQLGSVVADTIWFQNDISETPSASALVDKLLKEYGAPVAYSQSESSGPGFFSSAVVTTNRIHFAWTSTLTPSGKIASEMTLEEFNSYTKSVPEILLTAQVSTTSSTRSNSTGLTLKLTDARIFRDVASPEIRLR